MRIVIRALAIGIIAASMLPAQSSKVRPEIRPFAGAYVPTGTMADDFKTGMTLGVQGAVELSNWLHVLGTTSWTDVRTKLPGFSTDLTYVWQYDVGAEFNLYREVGDGWLLRPFAGAGVGGRTYDYRAANITNRTCTAGYAALGSEIQKRSFAYRVEARNYLSCFESPISGEKKTRSDIGLAVGLAYHIR